MERWCETAAAVANGWRRLKLTPAQAAAHAVFWETMCDKDPSLPRCSDSVAQAAAGEFDCTVRWVDRHGHVR